MIPINLKDGAYYCLNIQVIKHQEVESKYCIDVNSFSRCNICNKIGFTSYILGVMGWERCQWTFHGPELDMDIPELPRY